jgi:anti-anti-sigma factor
VQLPHRTQLAVRADPGINGLRIRLSGEIDEACADQLIHAVRDELPPEHTLNIDLAHVTFCDSCGINALIQIHKHQAAAGHTMRLINTPANIRRVIEIAGLHGYLDMSEGPQPLAPTSKPRAA